MNQHSNPSESEATEKRDVSAEPLQFMRINTILADDAFSPALAQPSDMKNNKSPAVPDIVVNGEVIESKAILAEAQHHPADDAESALEEAARALVIKSLLLQEADRLELQEIPETDADGRHETQEDSLIRTLLDQEVRPPQATLSDCQRYYDSHADKFCSDTLYEVRHILLAASLENESERESQRAQAEVLISHLQSKPGDFNMLVREHSDCPSRHHDGNLGQLTPGSTVREFEQALKTMNPGELSSAPVETRYGFHVVLVERCVPGQVLPFDAVRERIAAWLEASSWSRAMSQYVSILAGRADLQGYKLRASDSPLVQ